MVSSASAVFDHALADDLVDRRVGERGGDGLASTLAFPVVGDPLGVGADVAVELADRLEQPSLLRVGLGDLEIEDQVVDSLQGAEDVAVPAEPLQPLQLRADLVGEAGRRLVRDFRVRRGRSQALGRVGHDGDPHRQVEPVQQVLSLGVEIERQVADVFAAVGEDG